jgi:hypothetical protein
MLKGILEFYAVVVIQHSLFHRRLFFFFEVDVIVVAFL